MRFMAEISSSKNSDRKRKLDFLLNHYPGVAASQIYPAPYRANVRDLRRQAKRPGQRA